MDPIQEFPPFDLGRLRSKGGISSRIGLVQCSE